MNESASSPQSLPPPPATSRVATSPLPAIPRGMVSPVCRIIAGLIRQHREARGWTPDRLAELTALSRQMINFVENCKRIPSLDTLARIGRALGVPLSRLLAEAECVRRAQGCNYSCIECQQPVVM